ncbi:35047_t:CDS:2, partial [Gigaspora margarita]
FVSLSFVGVVHGVNSSYTGAVVYKSLRVASLGFVISSFVGIVP